MGINELGSWQTCDCMIACRQACIRFTHPITSISPPDSNVSRMSSRQTYTPLLPTPALKQASKIIGQFSWFLRFLSTTHKNHDINLYPRTNQLAFMFSPIIPLPHSVHASLWYQNYPRSGVWSSFHLLVTEFEIGYLQTLAFGGSVSLTWVVPLSH